MQDEGRWLWILAALFALRVAAQPLALVVDAPILPRFESWHNGLLPYPLLLGAQLLILAWLVTTAYRVSHAAVQPSRLFGRLVIGVAGVYGMTMLTRLLPGATVIREVRWFASPVPTVFHLVLAGYLFIYGRVHYRYGY
jgi:hypothetical protein